MRLCTLAVRVPGVSRGTRFEDNSAERARIDGSAERILFFLSLVISAEWASWSQLRRYKLRDEFWMVVTSRPSFHTPSISPFEHPGPLSGRSLDPYT